MLILYPRLTMPKLVERRRKQASIFATRPLRIAAEHSARHPPRGRPR
jgi:hypothetical protein